VVGFKPTYGRVSLRGVIPLSWTLDHCGPICKTVEDAGLMLQVIAGYDPLDPATVSVPVPDYSRGLQMEAARFRLGIPRSPFFENLNPEVAKAVEEAIRVLRKLTKSVTDTKLPQSRPRSRSSERKRTRTIQNGLPNLPGCTSLSLASGSFNLRPA
jgi:aspartyl-tRNA(Asn)/glutamyl-tRNA(Gln) amidotransferase subunit A